MLVEIVDEQCCIVCLQVAAIVSDDVSILQRDDVTAQRKVVVGHLIADGSSFQWASSFIYFVEVVT